MPPATQLHQVVNVLVEATPSIPTMLVQLGHLFLPEQRGS